MILIPLAWFRELNCHKINITAVKLGGIYWMEKPSDNYLVPKQRFCFCLKIFNFKFRYSVQHHAMKTKQKKLSTFLGNYRQQIYLYLCGFWESLTNSWAIFKFVKDLLFIFWNNISGRISICHPFNKHLDHKNRKKTDKTQIILPCSLIL